MSFTYRNGQIIALGPWGGPISLREAQDLCFDLTAEVEALRYRSPEQRRIAARSAAALMLAMARYEQEHEVEA